MRIIGSLVISGLLSSLMGSLIFFGPTAVFITVPAGVLIALIAGFPTYLMLRRMGWLNLWRVLTAGLLITLPIAVAIYVEIASIFLVFAVLATGVFGALLFWWFGVSVALRTTKGSTGRRETSGPARPGESTDGAG